MFCDSRSRSIVIFLMITCMIVGSCQYPDQRLDEIEAKIEERYADELENMTTQRDYLRNGLDKITDENMSLKLKLNQAEQRIDDLEKEILKTHSTEPEIMPMDIVPGSTMVLGKIKSINTSNNLLIVSLGKGDKIVNGSELEIHRNDHVIGKIKIDRVSTDWSTAHSIRPADIIRFRVGDSALGLVTD